MTDTPDSPDTSDSDGTRLDLEREIATEVAWMQVTLDKVAVHLLQQNAASIQRIDGSTLAGYCAYRTEDGLRCAIGCLLSDEEAAKMEGRGVRNFPSSLLTKLLGRPPAFQPTEWEAAFQPTGIDSRVEFLNALQKIHDSMVVTTWRAELCALAARHQFQVRF